VAARWEGEVQRASGVLDEAHERSILPIKPQNGRELEMWLLEEREKRF
jgi:hypothetical protein